MPTTLRPFALQLLIYKIYNRVNNGVISQRLINLVVVITIEFDQLGLIIQCDNRLVQRRAAVHKCDSLIM